MWNRNIATGLLLILPLSAIANQKSTAKTGFKQTLKKGLNKGLDAMESIPLIGGMVKGARKLIPGADASNEMVGLMEEQVETSKTALEQMQSLAKDILALKHEIDKAAAIKKKGEQLFKDLTDAKYGKVVVSIAEQISQISVKPSDYIPSLEAAGSPKRSSSFSCYREKALRGSMDSFENRAEKCLDSQPKKELNELCNDIQKELLRAEQIKIATKESNNQLIPIYKEQIKQLEIQNKKIEQTLVDPRFAKDDPLKLFQLESIKHKNNMRMGKLVEKINKLTNQSEEVSKADKTAIAELYSEALYQALLRQTIAQKQKIRYKK